MPRAIEKANDKDLRDQKERYRNRDSGPPQQSTLKPRDIREIRQRADDGESPARLGKEFGVGRTAIWNILSGIRHKDVK